MLDDARTKPTCCACDEVFELCPLWILASKKIRKLEVKLKKSIYKGQLYMRYFMFAKSTELLEMRLPTKTPSSRSHGARTYKFQVLRLPAW
jgi:hypothetical protein